MNWCSDILQKKHSRAMPTAHDLFRAMIKVGDWGLKFSWVVNFQRLDKEEGITSGKVSLDSRELESQSKICTSRDLILEARKLSVGICEGTEDPVSFIPLFKKRQNTWNPGSTFSRRTQPCEICTTLLKPEKYGAAWLWEDTVWQRAVDKFNPDW